MHLLLTRSTAGVKALEKPDVARGYLVCCGTPGSGLVKTDSVRALMDLVGQWTLLYTLVARGYSTGASVIDDVRSHSQHLHNTLSEI